MNNDYQADIDIVTHSIKALGHERINPESLIALREEADTFGWSINPEYSAHETRGAYNRLMAGFRALLAPL